MVSGKNEMWGKRTKIRLRLLPFHSQTWLYPVDHISIAVANRSVSFMGMSIIDGWADE